MFDPDTYFPASVALPRWVGVRNLALACFFATFTAFCLLPFMQYADANDWRAQRPKHDLAVERTGGGEVSVQQ